MKTEIVVGIENLIIEDRVIETLSIEVTRACNLDCSHCLRGPAEKSVFDCTKLAELFSKRDIKYVRSLVLTGGEPLLRPDIIEMIVETFEAYSVRMGSFFIATNGTAFSKKAFKAIAYLSHITEDREANFIKISNSIYHEEAIDRLGKHIPKINSLYDIWSEFRWFEGIVNQTYGYTLDELKIEREKQNMTSYHPGNLIGEGRSRGTGHEAAKDMEVIYLGAKGACFQGYADLSFDSQDKYVKGDYYISHDYVV